VNALLERLDKAGSFLEDTLLVLLLSSMIGLASWQIIGRNLFSSNFSLGDELLRLMVLWLTLAGAMAASRADRHISIALLDRFLGGRKLALARVATQLFTATVCGMIAWYSWEYLLESREYGDILLGGKPAWWFLSILPVGFGLMCYRHLVHTARQLRLVVRGTDEK
jgi:TRAP-type C4-dicarboxylate transport system permease small subunit